MVLDEVGLEQLSLRALARDLGVSHGAPLRHFATKTELLSEIARVGVEQLMSSAGDTDKYAPGKERLFNMVLAYVQWANDNSAYHQVLRNPEVLRHVPDDIKEKLLQFALIQRQQIEIAQQQGWRSDEDSEVLFIHLVSLTAGTAIVMNDLMYRPILGDEKNLQKIAASIRIFLEIG